MNDKELLEQAAKAAGIELLKWNDYYKGFMTSVAFSNAWNPLTDDGDALRLAVKLGLEVSCGAKARDPETKERFDITMVTGDDAFKTEHHSSDPYAATRRAIVRAAAEIGKEIK